MTCGGIRSAKYEQLKRLIVQNYGFQEAFTLMTLERLGAIRRKDGILSVVGAESSSSSLWQLQRKQLKLINENVNMLRPDDIAYVTAGYAPLSCRLIELVIVLVL